MDSSTSGGQGVAEIAEYVACKGQVRTPLSIDLGEHIEYLGEKLVCFSQFGSQNHKFEYWNFFGTGLFRRLPGVVRLRISVI
jgi:hypothetical protein